MRDDKITMHRLFQNVDSEIDNDLEDLLKLDESEVQDRLHEIADSNVPIYNYTLLEICMDNLEIGFPDDSDVCAAAIEERGAYGVIAWSIYESLRNHAHETFESRKEDHEADLERRKEDGVRAYRVTLHRTVGQSVTMDVEAANEEGARTLAEGVARAEPNRLAWQIGKAGDFPRAHEVVDLDKEEEG